MRELDECTAEVFRRGEKRIEQRRRRRNRVLAVCIPVCLIVAVWSVMSLPAMMPVVDNIDRAPTEMIDSASQSLACPYTAVEIQDAGLYPEEHYGKVTDSLAVTEMFRAIYSLFADIDGNDRESSGNLPAAEDNTNHDLTDSANKWKDCMITFTTEDGLQAVYYLSGNMLVNVSTNETVSLSDVQVSGLLAVLGISE